MLLMQMNHMVQVYSVAKVLQRLVKGRKFCSLCLNLLLEKKLLQITALQVNPNAWTLESKSTADVTPCSITNSNIYFARLLICLIVTVSLELIFQFSDKSYVKLILYKYMFFLEYTTICFIFVIRCLLFSLLWSDYFYI